MDVYQTLQVTDLNPNRASEHVTAPPTTITQVYFMSTLCGLSDCVISARQAMNCCTTWWQFGPKFLSLSGFCPRLSLVTKAPDRLSLSVAWVCTDEQRFNHVSQLSTISWKLRDVTSPLVSTVPIIRTSSAGMSFTVRLASQFQRHEESQGKECWGRLTPRGLRQPLPDT